jgi:hypothetical protein
MECDPTERLEIERDALPPLKVALPSDVELSKNFMVPVAVAEDTVAENVTFIPYVEGLRLELRAVVVPAGFTLWTRTDDVLLLKLGSPL